VAHGKGGVMVLLFLRGERAGRELEIAHTGTFGCTLSMLELEAGYGDNMGVVLSDKVVKGAFRCMSPTTLFELWYNGINGSNNGLMSETCVCIITWGRETRKSSLSSPFPS